METSRGSSLETSEESSGKSSGEPSKYPNRKPRGEVMSLLTQNSKLKKDGIFNFTLPAYKSQTGFITCPTAKDCVANCYARQGCYTFSNVKAKHEANLQATFKDDFCEVMIAEIIEKNCNIVRIHDSGDMYSREYLHKWFKIMESLSHVKFYSYSKQVAMLKAERLPENFEVIYSFGGFQDNLINVDKDKHAKCFLNKIPKKYINASNSDLNALKENINVGLLFHGTKKIIKNGFIYE